MAYLSIPLGQALQALAVVLRGAHDDAHPFAAQCRPVWEIRTTGRGRVVKGGGR